MKNPLNTRFNKANWSAAANAILVLVNSRLPFDVQFDEVEQGLIMVVITFLVVALVPNAKASK